jgi:hypothetical protein
LYVSISRESFPNKLKKNQVFYGGIVVYARQARRKIGERKLFDMTALTLGRTSLFLAMAVETQSVAKTLVELGMSR